MQMRMGEDNHFLGPDLQQEYREAGPVDSAVLHEWALVRESRTVYRRFSVPESDEEDSPRVQNIRRRSDNRTVPVVALFVRRPRERPSKTEK